MTDAPYQEKYLDPQILAQVQGLELRARLVVEGYLAGMHRSPYHGFSVEFAQHREYTPGDDIKHMDWKVFARTERYFLKQHEEETNLVCWLLVDISESMRYGSGALTKHDYAGLVAASLAYLVLRQQDSVGLITFDDRVRHTVPPSSRPSSIHEIVNVLDRGAGRERTELEPILHELADRLQRRGLVIVLSDFFDIGVGQAAGLPREHGRPAACPTAGGLLPGLRHLRYRRHDVVLFHVLDAAELDFPFEEATLFRGLENLPELLADPASLRRGYLQAINTFVSGLQEGCREHDIDYVQLRTDVSLAKALSCYMAHRSRL